MPTYREMRSFLAVLLVASVMASSASAAPRLTFREEIQKERATRSLRAFVEQAWPIVEPDQTFVPNWHIDAICAHLEAVTRGEIKNLLINIPPGCMKSLIVSVMWPAWEWASNPSMRYLCVSYDQELSTRDNVRCRTILESDWYQRFWPEVQFSADENRKLKYETTRRGWRIATSPTGRATGEHPDRKIIDDPHNAKQAESDAERQVALNFLDRTLSTRGKARGAATVVIMQRLDERDLAGHILAKENAADWVVICLPMRFEPERMKPSPLGWTDPRTEEGELLWPALFPERYVHELEIDLGSYGAAGQLQQRPAAMQGGIIKRALWRYYPPNEPPRDIDLVVISVDSALKAKTLSDHSAIQVWGRRRADRFLLTGDVGRFEYSDLKRRLKGFYAWAVERYPAPGIVVLIENTAVGPDLIADLRDDVPGIIGEDPEGDKVQRAIAGTPVLESGNVFLPGASNPQGTDYDKARTPVWVQAFVDECASFPKGKDDQVDAWSQAMKRMKLMVMNISDVLSSGDTTETRRF